MKLRAMKSTKTRAFCRVQFKRQNLYLIRNMASSHNTAMKTFAFMSVHIAIL